MKRKMRRKWERDKETKKTYYLKGKTPICNAVSRDYLKYFRVVKYWAMRQHGLTGADVDMLLFLNSEYLFKRSDFTAYQQIFPWDTVRFQDLVKRGFISAFREKTRGQVFLYTVSVRAKHIIKSIYDKLEMKETMSETAWRNPMFQKKVGYQDKVYRNVMKKVNKEIREQQQRPDQE